LNEEVTSEGVVIACALTKTDSKQHTIQNKFRSITGAGKFGFNGLGCELFTGIPVEGS
jgi:hypothetical protein